jgi:hypothetical protein
MQMKNHWHFLESIGKLHHMKRGFPNGANGFLGFFLDLSDSVFIAALHLRNQASRSGWCFHGFTLQGIHAGQFSGVESIYSVF